jgi:hypothetical protein
MPAIRYNILLYLAFLGLATIGLWYGQAIQDNHSFLRVWSYQNILLLLLGIPFLFLQTKANLPNFLDESIPNTQRFRHPLLLGALFGLLDILVIKVLLHPEPYTELPPFLQPFPYALFLYFSGAFEVEVFYRLIPITLILLLGQWWSAGKYKAIFLWTAIVLTAIREPLEQMPSGEVWFIAYALLTGFLMNLLQAIYYTRAGFLASLSIRLGHYLFWHILLGLYVQFIELS